MERMEQSQLEELIDRYGNDVLRYAYLYLGDRGWAEDASQQVFLKVYQNWAKYRGDASPRTWILRITINTCKNILGSRAYRRGQAECSLDALQSQPAVEFEREKLEIWQEVLRLSALYRDVVLLKYYNGYNNSEIAGLLGLKEPAVRTRLSRAMAQLRENMEGRGASYDTQAEGQSL